MSEQLPFQNTSSPSSVLPSDSTSDTLITAAAAPTTTTTTTNTATKVIKPKKKSKKLCHYKTCTSPHSIIGDCNFCFKKFCTRHRLLESHDCEHYRDVQKDYHDRNAKQLQNNQTVVSKV